MMRHPFPKKPLSDLVEADLLRLIEDGVSEGKEVEYKREIEKDPVEFAKDVTAFANVK